MFCSTGPNAAPRQGVTSWATGNGSETRPRRPARGAGARRLLISRAKLRSVTRKYEARLLARIALRSSRRNVGTHRGPLAGEARTGWASVHDCPLWGGDLAGCCCHCLAVTDETTRSDRGNRLVRFAEYERPWVGRAGLALGVMLWLFVTAVAFGVGLANGLTILILGGTLIFGEVWIERSGERHPTRRSQLSGASPW